MTPLDQDGKDAKDGKDGLKHHTSFIAEPGSIVSTPRMAQPFISIQFQKREASKRDQGSQRVIDIHIERYWLALC